MKGNIVFMEEKILKRNEVPTENTWRLEDMFETNEAWFELFEKCGSIPQELSGFKGEISKSAQSLLEYLQYSDKTGLDITALAEYAMRRNDEDQANPYYIDMKGKIMQLYYTVAGADSFAAPEIISIDDEKLEEFYRTAPGLELYRRFLTKLRRKKPHMLSDAEERILAESGRLAETAEEINSVLTNTELKFPKVLDSEGKEHVLTQGTYINILHSPDRTLRKNTFEAFYSVFDGVKNTIAATLNGQVKQLKFYADMRKYESTIEASLDSTEVPPQVYYNLIEAVHGNMDKMYKYVALRKKLMKVDELHMYDIYCPIVNEMNKEITYEEAKKNVIEGLSVLGEDYISVLKEGFENRWIDVYENEGKRGGAYSSCGRPHPYVLLNHKNNLDCQFTLAHEMGHSLHTYLSIKNQPVIYSDYVIFVAEVASTCNEVLLMRYLLSKTTDKKEKAYLINYFLEQFRTTLYRQTMFAEFELDINRMAEAGESLTADALNNRYYALNKLYYGDGMVVDDAIKVEWARIPHFFYDYYVFQYATGFAAAVAIANRILTEGEPAVKDYLKFLSGGKSRDPISLLKIAGVDMATPQPVNEALKLFDSLIDEMDALLDE